MSWVRGTKISRRQWNRLLDAVATIIKYKKITIDNDIYIEVFSYETVSYLMVSTFGVLNTDNNKT